MPQQEKIYTKRGNYTIGQTEPYRLSRSKIDLFLNCQRCFYLDRKLGIPQPPGFPFTLNTAVDTLLKKEFDIHRAQKTAHPFIEKYGLIDVVPYQNDLIDEWRNALSGGICYLHKPTNFYITGGVDDVWENTKTKELIIVDYKATSKDGEVNLDANWQIGYKRQIEVYQWLFRQNGFKVSDIGYFVYCNGITDKEAFDAKLEFDVKLLPYKGDPSWIEQTLLDIKACLESQTMPQSNFNCPYCNYRKAVRILKLET